MTHQISCTERIARKPYSCMSCEWLADVEDFSDFSFAEKRVLVKLLRQKNGMIDRGDKYMEYVGVYDGEIIRSRYHQEAHALCQRHNIYCYD